jgi:hypothetical protein
LSQAHENAGENHPHLKQSRASARRLRKVRSAACIDLANRTKSASPFVITAHAAQNAQIGATSSLV